MKLFYASAVYRSQFRSYFILVLGIADPSICQCWGQVQLQILLYASAGDMFHCRSYFMLVMGISPTADPISCQCQGQVLPQILFHASAGDRSHCRSYFMLVLGIVPTTDPILWQCWGQFPIQILLPSLAPVGNFIEIELSQPQFQLLLPHPHLGKYQTKPRLILKKADSQILIRQDLVCFKYNHPRPPSPY